ncbi:MAG: amphi-Trp domain-containing protein [Actinobacteria bacterium]|nr:amphi-Trp domain-containing protein [Actinomycetota bacterium]
MELEYSSEERLRREAAADRLHQIADELSRQNEVSFEREGRRFTVQVPDEVNFKFEVEIDDEESEVEIELTW